MIGGDALDQLAMPYEESYGLWIRPELGVGQRGSKSSRDIGFGCGPVERSVGVPCQLSRVQIDSSSNSVYRSPIVYLIIEFTRDAGEYRRQW